jgi:hypothetical protein
MEIMDWRGNTIKVGSTVVYATAQSSSITMKEGTVVEIGKVEREYSYKESEPYLKVAYKGDNGHTEGLRGWQKPGKLVTLTVLQRVTVIPPTNSRPVTSWDYMYGRWR